MRIIVFSIVFEISVLYYKRLSSKKRKHKTTDSIDTLSDRASPNTICSPPQEAPTYFLRLTIRKESLVFHIHLFVGFLFSQHARANRRRHPCRKGPCNYKVGSWHGFSPCSKDPSLNARSLDIRRSPAFGFGPRSGGARRIRDRSYF